jgi:hypothetical protein
MSRVIRTEGKVKCLRWEVPDDVGSVSSPEGDKTLLPVCAGESVPDTLVRGRETALLDLRGYATSECPREGNRKRYQPSHPGSAPAT